MIFISTCATPAKQRVISASSFTLCGRTLERLCRGCPALAIAFHEHGAVQVSVTLRDCSSGLGVALRNCSSGVGVMLSGEVYKCATLQIVTDRVSESRVGRLTFVVMQTVRELLTGSADGIEAEGHPAVVIALTSRCGRKNYINARVAMIVLTHLRCF